MILFTYNSSYFDTIFVNILNHLFYMFFTFTIFNFILLFFFLLYIYRLYTSHLLLLIARFYTNSLLNPLFFSIVLYLYSKMVVDGSFYAIGFNIYLLQLLITFSIIFIIFCYIIHYWQKKFPYFFIHIHLIFLVCTFHFKRISHFHLVVFIHFILWTSRLRL